MCELQIPPRLLLSVDFFFLFFPFLTRSQTIQIYRFWYSVSFCGFFFFGYFMEHEQFILVIIWWCNYFNTNKWKYINVFWNQLLIRGSKKFLKQKTNNIKKKKYEQRIVFTALILLEMSRIINNLTIVYVHLFSKHTKYCIQFVNFAKYWCVS